jgi:SAM-dependent methyltransferase
VSLRRHALSVYLRRRPAAPDLAPHRLYAFLDALWHRRDSVGAVVEVGCWRGGTTRVAYRFLQAIQSPRQYVAIDTFAGFVDDHFQRDRRHGTPLRLRAGFAVNSFDAVRRSLDAAGCGDVDLIQGEITTLPDSMLPESVAVSLIDVDLDIPTYTGLVRIAKRLAPDGIVLVDDCDQESGFKGARAGYRRFAAEHSYAEDYFMGMGIIRSANQLQANPQPRVLGASSGRTHR